jgi:hypothetical protein
MDTDKVGGWVVSESKFFELYDITIPHCKSWDNVRETLYRFSPLMWTGKDWYFTQFVKEDGVSREMWTDEIIEFCKVNNVRI